MHDEPEGTRARRDVSSVGARSGVRRRPGRHAAEKIGAGESRAHLTTCSTWPKAKSDQNTSFALTTIPFAWVCPVASVVGAPPVMGAIATIPPGFWLVTQYTCAESIAIDPAWT